MVRTTAGSQLPLQVAARTARAVAAVARHARVLELEWADPHKLPQNLVGDLGAPPLQVQHNRLQRKTTDSTHARTHSSTRQPAQVNARRESMQMQRRHSEASAYSDGVDEDLLQLPRQHPAGLVLLTNLHKACRQKR